MIISVVVVVASRRSTHKNEKEKTISKQKSKDECPRSCYLAQDSSSLRVFPRRNGNRALNFKFESCGREISSHHQVKSRAARARSAVILQKQKGKSVQLMRLINRLFHSERKYMKKNEVERALVSEAGGQHSYVSTIHTDMQS